MGLERSPKACHKKFTHFWQLFSGASYPGINKRNHCLELWAAKGASTALALQPTCTAGFQGTHWCQHTLCLWASFCPQQGKPALPSQLCRRCSQQGPNLKALPTILCSPGTSGCKKHQWHQTPWWLQTSTWGWGGSLRWEAMARLWDCFSQYSHVAQQAVCGTDRNHRSINWLITPANYIEQIDKINIWCRSLERLYGSIFHR